VSLKTRITEDMKNAMRAKETARLGAIRLLQSAIKQREVDERIELDDDQVIATIEKMLKQRRDSIQQYEAAQRQDLADAEKFEVQVLQAYLPTPLSEQEISQMISLAITASGAQGMQDMGKVMGLVRPQVLGRADMAKISAEIKAKLG
jgi:uncharacterized protein YqeY